MLAAIALTTRARAPSCSPATTSSTRRRSAARPPTCRGSPSSAARACCCCAATPRTSTARASRDSESVVGPHLERVFARCQGRIVVTCFASNIHRVQQVVARGRGATTARSRWSAARCARTSTSAAALGPHRHPGGDARAAARDRPVAGRADRGHLRPARRASRCRALRRMAYRDHPQVELHEGDTVVFSRHADPRQRARGQRDDRPALPHRLRRSITAARRADPRLRPRLRGGGQDDAQPHPAALRDAGPRRLQADADPPPARRGGRRAAGEHLPHRERARRWRSTPHGARFGRHGPRA